MRISAAMLCVLLCVSMLLLPACGNKPKKPATSSATSESGSGDSQILDESTDDSTTPDGDSSVAGDPTDSSVAPGGSSSAGSKATVGGGTVKTNIPTTDAAKWGTEKGLATTKKLPTKIKSISNGNLVALAAALPSKEDAAYEKQVFKQQTGKDLNITYKVVGWNDLRSTLSTMVAAGNGPDIFSIYNGVAYYLRNKGIFRDVRDYINMNDGVWNDMKPYSETMFYRGELTGVCINKPVVQYGFVYNKTLMKQAGLQDPFTLWKNKKWDIKTFLNYVSELTVDKNHDNKPEVYGVSMPPENIFQMALASGQDLVKVNSDGTFTNNMKNATFTRWASYAKEITKAGSYDTESWTSLNRFIQGTVAMRSGTLYDMFANDKMIAMKKADKIGFVPNPMDINQSTDYQRAEINYVFLPKKSKNPEGAAAYYYIQRFIELNPSATKKAADKKKYTEQYHFTAEEYDLVDNMYKKVTPITFNWQHVPDFDYTTLWSVFTDDWNTVLSKVYGKLDYALKQQNKA